MEVRWYHHWRDADAGLHFCSPTSWLKSLEVLRLEGQVLLLPAGTLSTSVGGQWAPQAQGPGQTPSRGFCSAIC